MSLHWIENDRLRVGVNVAYGARIASLVDKGSGREWMTAGGDSPNTGEDAQYGGDEAVGWDECFPTVSRWDASATPWGRNLRDHGDLWGRPWHVDRHTDAELTTTYADAQFTFTRSLTLDGPKLVAAYSVENRTNQALPYLWALHALLAAEPDDDIELGSLESTWSVFMSLGGKVQPSGPVTWTEPPPGLTFPLSRTPPASADFMGKLYSSHAPGGYGRIGKPGARLAFHLDDRLRHFGIWLTYGAWPKTGGHYEVALEPTNAPSDHVGQTIADGYPPIPPFGRHDWTVTVTVETPPVTGSGD